MRKLLFKSMVALAVLCLGTMNVAAQNKTGIAPVKMTYVSGSDADVDVPYGECDTIKAGWNRGDLVAVGSTIGFGNKGWGANWIGVIKADLSAIPGTVQKATLKAKVSGSLDSKRPTVWGVALTDNVWSADLTYTTVSTWTVSAMLNGGVQVWTTSSSSTGFEEKEWDITDAFAGGLSVATILVYEGVKANNGGAAGGFMTEAVVEVEYEPFEATTTTYDFESKEGEEAVNPFTDDSRISSAIAKDDVLNSNVIVFTAAGNCQNGYGFAHYDFSNNLNKPANVSVEFDYYNEAGTRSILTLGDAMVRGDNGGCAKNTYGSKGAVFRIGSDKSNAFINGINLPQADNETESYVYNVDNETGDTISVDTIKNVIPGFCNKWLHVSVMANIDARTVAWTVTDMEGKVLHQGADAFWQDDATALSQIDVFAWINNSMSGKVDNLTITNYKSNAVFADYTIKYVDSEGNEIKEARTGNGQVGKFVKLLDSDKASLYNEDKTKKYIYLSDDSETTPIAEEGTVITVTFRDAEVYYAVLNCIIDGQTMATGRLEQFRDDNKYWFFEGDNLYIRPAIAYAKDGKYYKVDPDSYNGKVYTFPGSVSPAVNGGKTYYIGTLYYTLDETIAYHSDMERLALPVEDAGEGTGLGQLVGTVNNWWCFSGAGQYFDRFSQGRGIRLDNGSYVYTEPIAEEGTYKVRLYGRNDRSANCVAPYSLGLRDADGNVTLLDVTVPDWGSATTGESVVGNEAVEGQEATEESEAVEAVEAAGIGIPAGMSLVIMNTGNGSMISLDDITLTKVADYAETATKDQTYTVAGSYKVGDEEQAAFFGAVWDIENAENDMVKGEDGLYTKTFEGVTFEQTGTIYYKVGLNHGWIESYGFDGDNADYYVEVPEGGTRTADVVFTFDPATKTVSCELIEETEPATYTLVGAVKVGEEETPAFFGKVWDVESTANEMTLGEDGIYTLTFEKVKFDEPSTILYKVAENHAWTKTWGFVGSDENPNGNADYVVNTPGVYTVTFYFNPDALLENGFNVHCVLEGMKGDVNRDGEVGIGDIVTITNYMAGLDESLTLEQCDVNGDGEVGIGDIVTITNIMAGINTEPVEEPAEEPVQE